jgi:response regulator NasT
MRIWLVEDPSDPEKERLEATLRQLADDPSEGHVLVGARPLGPSLLRDVRAQPLDVLIIAQAAWPAEPVLSDLMEMDLGFLVATNAARCCRFQAQAHVNPIWFIPPQPTVETLRLALCGLAACMKRQTRWKAQVASLQKRLDDRILIERAKGILVSRLAISEEEAYKRLRISSRRQRRQIRDIARSLLDTQALLVPEFDGSSGSLLHEIANELGNGQH